MLKRASAALIFVLGLSAQCALASPINIVTNGNFEAGNLSGWTAVPDPDPLGGQFVGSDFSFSPAPHGGMVFKDAAFNVVGTISQTLATTAGAVYKLEFDLQRFDTNNGDIDNFAQVSFSGAVLLQQTNVGGDWTHFVFANLTAGGPSALLSFGNRNYWDYNQLDNISVVKTSPDDAPPPGNVPEPGSAVLILAALGLLGWTRRKA